MLRNRRGWGEFVAQAELFALKKNLSGQLTPACGNSPGEETLMQFRRPAIASGASISRRPTAPSAGRWQKSVFSHQTDSQIRAQERSCSRILFLGCGNSRSDGQRLTRFYSARVKGPAAIGPPTGQRVIRWLSPEFRPRLLLHSSSLRAEIPLQLPLALRLPTQVQASRELQFVAVDRSIGPKACTGITPIPVVWLRLSLRSSRSTRLVPSGQK